MIESTDWVELFNQLEASRDWPILTFPEDDGSVTCIGEYPNIFLKFVDEVIADPRFPHITSFDDYQIDSTLWELVSLGAIELPIPWDLMKELPVRFHEFYADYIEEPPNP